MNVEYSKDFEKSVKKLSGKILGSIRKVITEVKNAENIKEITDCKKLVGCKRSFKTRRPHKNKRIYCLLRKTRLNPMLIQ